MRLRVLPGPAEVARAAADQLARAVAARAEGPLGLPTGRTALPLYDELAARHTRGTLDLSRTRGFNLDELVLPRDDARSFHAFMRRHAWGRTGLDPQRCEIPDGMASDLERECRRYDAALDAAGGLDVALLGVGRDGHVAYNLPSALPARTHIVQLPAEVAEALEVPERARPLRAVTMGLGTLREARTIILMATGPSKAEAVRALVRGRQDPQWPCSLLQAHPELEVIVDREAAGCL